MKAMGRRLDRHNGHVSLRWDPASEINDHNLGSRHHADQSAPEGAEHRLDDGPGDPDASKDLDPPDPKAEETAFQTDLSNRHGHPRPNPFPL